MIQRQGGHHGFNPTGCAQEVAEHGFRGTHRQLGGMVPEYGLDRLRFDFIRKGRGRMCVHVPDRRFRDPRVTNGLFDTIHGAGAVIRRRGDVKGIAGHGVAGQFSVDFGAAPLRVLQFFQHQHAGAFSDHESIPVTVKRTTRPLRVVVTT